MFCIVNYYIKKIAYFRAMKVIGIIPSRYASSRFPGKPLIDLNGKTMIQRVYENASQSKLLDEIIVATDDKRIFDHVVNFGGKVIMTSSDHQSGTDRCAEIARNINADIIVNIQGDEPLVDPKQLDELTKVFEDQTVKIATLATKNIVLNDIENPNRIKIVVDKKNDALYFSRSFIPNSTHFNGIDTEFYPFLKHIGLYAFRRNILIELSNLPTTKLEKIESLEQLRWLYYGYNIRIVETIIETPNIDVPDDVQRVIKILKSSTK